MRIALVTDDATYHLAGEEGVSERVHSSAGDLKIGPEASKQIIRPVRAANARAKDRGNLLMMLSFSTTRLFDTPAAAFLFALDYDANFGREGTLVLTVTSESGTQTRNLTRAVVDPPQRTVIGCTVFLSYTATGSEVEEPAPPEP